MRMQWLQSDYDLEHSNMQNIESQGQREALAGQTVSTMGVERITWEV